MERTTSGEHGSGWLSGALHSVPSGTVSVHKAITVNVTPEQAYAFWRQLTNLPRFMTHLKRVEISNNTVSRWTACAPLGGEVTWEAEITEDSPGKTLAWHSLPGSDIANAGTVRFLPAPGKRGCEVRVELRYAAPAGSAGAAFAKLFGEEPSVQINGDLRRFKQVMELGHVVVSNATLKRETGNGHESNLLAR